MLQRAFQNVRYDLHVLVRMRWKTAAARNAVIFMTRTALRNCTYFGQNIRKRKVNRVSASRGRMTAIVALANRNHYSPPESLSTRHPNNTRYNDYCQEEYFTP